MATTHCRPVALVLAAMLGTLIGCGGSETRSGKIPDTRSAAQYFKEQQGTTVTPNGKIQTDTVEEKGGQIEYKTEDGKKWRVTYSKRADGTYQYGTPDEVK
jgi:hypothetical protein